MADQPKVAVVWRGDPDTATPPTPQTGRLRAIFEALTRQGLAAMPCIYSEERA